MARRHRLDDAIDERDVSSAKRIRLTNPLLTSDGLNKFFDSFNKDLATHMGLQYDLVNHKLVFRQDLTVKGIVECVQAMSTMKLRWDSLLVDSTMSTLTKQIIDLGYPDTLELLFNYFVRDSSMHKQSSGIHVGGGGITGTLENMHRVIPMSKHLEPLMEPDLVKAITSMTFYSPEQIMAEVKKPDFFQCIHGIYDLACFVMYYCSDSLWDLGMFHTIFWEHLICIQVHTSDSLNQLLRDDRYFPQTGFRISAQEIELADDVWHITKPVALIGMRNDCYVISPVTLKLNNHLVFEGGNVVLHDVFFKTTDACRRDIVLVDGTVIPEMMSGILKFMGGDTVSCKSVEVSGSGMYFQGVNSISLHSVSVSNATYGMYVKHVGTFEYTSDNSVDVGDHIKNGPYHSKITGCSTALKFEDVKNTIEIRGVEFRGNHAVIEAVVLCVVSFLKCSLVDGHTIGTAGSDNQVNVTDSFVCLRHPYFDNSPYYVSWLDTKIIKIKRRVTFDYEKGLQAVDYDTLIQSWFSCGRTDADSETGESDTSIVDDDPRAP